MLILKISSVIELSLGQSVIVIIMCVCLHVSVCVSYTQTEVFFIQMNFQQAKWQNFKDLDVKCMGIMSVETRSVIIFDQSSFLSMF